MGGLPFQFADIEMVVAGRTAPIDAVGGFAGNEGAKLPKGFAGTGLAASVPAGGDRDGDAAGFDQEGREGLPRPCANL